jgi:hypothetical protein
MAKKEWVYTLQMFGDVGVYTSLLNAQEDISVRMAENGMEDQEYVIICDNAHESGKKLRIMIDSDEIGSISRRIICPVDPVVKFHSTVIEGRKGDWQVIFKTIDDLDYCRESITGAWSRDKIREWVRNQCEKHGLAGAIIERW